MTSRIGVDTTNYYQSVIMKVLWITNILFPEAEHLLTGSGELKSSGGWMQGAANALLNNKEVRLCVASV